MADMLVKLYPLPTAPGLEEALREKGITIVKALAPDMSKIMDIRAGVAMLIAAMSAEGTSRIHNIEQIDRGYQEIDRRLNAIGARITRL